MCRCAAVPEQVAAVELTAVKSATKAQELERALSELQMATAQLSSPTPTVRGALGDGSGANLVPSGAYMPLPAQLPPFAMALPPAAPTILTGAAFDELLCSWSDSEHWQRCADVASEMRAAGNRPSAAAFSACCNCFVKNGRWGLVVSTLAAMRADGVAPVAGIFCALDRARRCGAAACTCTADAGSSIAAAAMSRRSVEYSTAMEYLFAETPSPLDVRFEDEDLLVVNKPVGCVVQPGRNWRYWSGTLAHATLAHCCRPGQPDRPLDWRPTVVHRLDKGTSGVMVLAKTELAARALRVEFAERTVDRVYQALLHGSPTLQAGSSSNSSGGSADNGYGGDGGGRLETCIGPDLAAGGRRMAVLPLTAASKKESGPKFAATRYRCLESLVGGRLSLVEFKLETGRTHQVRVHAAHLGCPLAGDSTYDDQDEERVALAVEAGVSADVHEALGLLKEEGQLLLHAGGLGFEHPRSGKRMQFTAPLPPAFEHILGLLRKNGCAEDAGGGGGGAAP